MDKSGVSLMLMLIKELGLIRVSQLLKEEKLLKVWKLAKHWKLTILMPLLEATPHRGRGSK